jgi:hypothetical protein
MARAMMGLAEVAASAYYSSFPSAISLGFLNPDDSHAERGLMMRNIIPPSR